MRRAWRTVCRRRSFRPSKAKIMPEITLSIPDDSLLALKLTPDKAGDELRLVAGIKLYELGRLSSGAGARLAGVPKPLFLMKLGEFGVPTFTLTEEELREDLEGNSRRPACSADALHATKQTS